MTREEVIEIIRNENGIYAEGYCDALDDVLDIINNRIMLIDNVIPGRKLEQELEIVKEKVLKLRGD